MIQDLFQTATKSIPFIGIDFFDPAASIIMYEYASQHAKF
jgi:hypothetical protein